MRFVPHTYQNRAIEFMRKTPFCAFFAEMGLGKTVVTLSAIDRMMYEDIEVDKVLVVAPKSVARNTWSAETVKWDHLKNLRMSVVMGTEHQRTAALEQDADIYVTNRDNVVWLVSQYCSGLMMNKSWPFDTVVLDESSSFKNHQSKRYKSLLKVRPFIRHLILLTGTPAPNGLMDLWSQIKLLDGGVRLGRYITQYREAYFHPGARNGAVVYEYIPNKGAKEKISEKISDICLSMQASDYLEMPAVMDGGMELELPELKAYRKFEQDCVMSLKDETVIEAVTAVALTNKLLQFASGAVYDDDHVWHDVSSAKIEALTDLLEQTDEPVLVFYNYKHELARIRQVRPDAVPFKGEPEILSDWNEGRIKVLLCHPASVAYGLNMQAGGHIIVWYSPTWNLEWYEQANARLNRQGQTKPVILYHLIAKGTMDEAVMRALKSKSNTQTALVKYLKNTMRNEV